MRFADSFNGELDGVRNAQASSQSRDVKMRHFSLLQLETLAPGGSQAGIRPAIKTV